ncbi:fibronectin type III domain-containing protein [Streptomyces albus]|uniref:fibronectin type III domain-containing protein n=1 Tax=Streptomyces albus TaxID=1888 RepID=UPI0033CD66B9
MPETRGSSDEGRTPGLRPRRLVDDTTKDEEARGPRGLAALRARCAALAAAAWAAVRPTRRRATGYIALCSVGALVGTSVVVGSGKAGAVPDLADIGAWLTSSRTGEAAHANGLTGDVDGKVKLPGMTDHPVSVSQDGKTVLVLDEKTGKLVRIDPSQLTVEQSSRYGAGLQLVSGGKYAYLVDPVKAQVQRIDPVRTTPIGAPVDLGAGPLGKAVADPKGTLWVPVPRKGTVVPFPHGKKARGIKVAAGGGRPESLLMTLADGRPVVTDTRAGTVTVLRHTGRGMRFQLPDAITKAPADAVLVPSATAGDVVPVLARTSGRMSLVNTRTGSLLSASLGSGSHDYGTPQVLGSKVYVPDHTNGTLKVYDTEAAAITEPVKVTGKRGKLSLFVRDGLLWVNDEDNETAVVINSSGRVNRVHKYDTDVPSGRKRDEDTPSGDDARRDPDPGRDAPDTAPQAPSGPGRDESPSGPDVPAGKPDKGGAARKPVPPEKSQLPEKPKDEEEPEKPKDEEEEPARTEPPGTPQAQSGPGTVTVTFAPSPGVKPTGYRLEGAPPGAEVKPGKVGPDGPFTFEVKGGSCDQQYSFSVVAEFAGGETAESGRSVPTRPCVAPGAPQNVKTAFPQGGRGIDLSWQAPANAGNGTKYAVSGAGFAAQNDLSRPRAALRGLKNNRTYDITVAARNAAGAGGTTPVRVDLSNVRNLRIADNVADGNEVGIRSVPSTKEGGRLGEVPPGETPPIKVICQVKGTEETHDSFGWKSDIWDRIEWEGKTAYVSDLWVSTTRHKEGQFSPEVWQCD